MAVANRGLWTGNAEDSPKSIALSPSSSQTIFFDREESAINQASSWRLYRHAAPRRAAVGNNAGHTILQSAMTASTCPSPATSPQSHFVAMLMCVLALFSARLCSYLYATLPSTATRHLHLPQAFLLIYSAHDKRQAEATHRGSDFWRNSSIATSTFEWND